MIDIVKLYAWLPMVQTISFALATVMVRFAEVYFLCRFAGKKLTLTRLMIYGGFAVLWWAFSFIAENEMLLFFYRISYLLLWSGYCVVILKKSWSFSATAGMILIIVTALYYDAYALNAYFSVYWSRRDSHMLYALTAIALPIFGFFKFFILYFIAKRYKVMAENPAEKQLYILLIPCALYTLLVTQDFFDMLGELNTAMSDGDISYAVVTKTVLVFSTAAIGLFITLSAFQKLCNYSNEEVEKAILLEQVKTQKSYIQESRQRYEENRSLQHDLKNHLLVLSGLISEDKTDEAQAYLDKLKSVADESALQINSGSLVVDILLSEKISHAIRLGIDAAYNVHIPSKCAIDDFDLCVIFSNALDNALTACADVSGKPHIEVNTGEKNRFFLIEFRNSCISGTTIREGTGLRNIRKIAEKYGGTVDIEMKNQTVNVSVLLCLN